MKIAAIPTTYAGVNFRSRLEARWAAFFDACGFEWEYEPFDYEDYIPDFLLCRHVLVEVKPVTWFPGDGMEQLAAVAEKLLQANEKRFHWCAILGARLLDPTPYSARSIGMWAQQYALDDDRFTWGPMEIDVWRDRPDAAPCFQLGAQPILDGSPMFFQPDYDLMWREAGNKVQWMPQRRRRHVVTRHVEVARTEPAEPVVPVEEVRAFFATLAQDAE